MSEPRVALDAYAKQDPADGDYGRVTREYLAPAAFAALRAVLDVHQRAPGYSWCMHCSGGEYTEAWPCPTVRAIATALEVR